MLLKTIETISSNCLISLLGIVSFSSNIVSDFNVLVVVVLSKHVKGNGNISHPQLVPFSHWHKQTQSHTHNQGINNVAVKLAAREGMGGEVYEYCYEYSPVQKSIDHLEGVEKCHSESSHVAGSLCYDKLKQTQQRDCVAQIVQAKRKKV